jgi:hypothetical protein
MRSGEASDGSSELPSAAAADRGRGGPSSWCGGPSSRRRPSFKLDVRPSFNISGRALLPAAAGGRGDGATPPHSPLNPIVLSAQVRFGGGARGSGLQGPGSPLPSAREEEMVVDMAAATSSSVSVSNPARRCWSRRAVLPRPQIRRLRCPSGEQQPLFPHGAAHSLPGATTG